MAHQMCFDCLQRRIQSEFSGKLVFIHGLSDSAFPFGSTAVVQLPNSSGEAASAPQFLLKYLPSHDQDCLTKYVNEYILDDADVNQEEEEVSSEICTDEKPKLDSLLAESRCLSNGGTKALLQTSTCNHSSMFSCSRVISALAPVSQVGICSDSMFEELASNFLSGSLEDHILNSLNLLIEGKPSGRDSVNFLNLLGVPSFDENQFPGSLRHPNFAPILGMVKTSGYLNIVLPKTPYTLENILHYSPDALKSDWHIRFLMYQLLSALAYIHGLGVAHGNICPSSVMLTESCWSWLYVCDKPGVGFNSSSRGNGFTITVPEKVACFVPDCPSQGLYTDLKLSPSIDWHRDFNQWWRGEISNFEYLLILNKLAGRRWGDHTFHTVMPWVVDFSIKPDENTDAGWRDLSKTKWRLAKGDEQLDFTYSTSEFPHHVSDECLSELAVCSYKARRLPLSVLRMAVRSVYEPNEYPSTMQRLYQWTPDECIPEFYCDPLIFNSLHAGMTDLAVPSWAGSPEEFIKLHREALESDRISRQLHHWIDITFGYKMSGQAAVAAKNVMLPSSESMMPRSVGRRQLFTQPHPMRRGAIRKPCNSIIESASYQGKIYELRSESSVLSDTAYLQELEDASAFCEHAMEVSALYGYQVKGVAPVEEQPSENVKENIPRSSDTNKNPWLPLQIDTNYLLEHIKVEDEGSTGYQELLLWRQKSSCLKTFTEDIARDIFSVGCLLAELHLRRPLFDPASFTMYLDSGHLPGLMHELPPHTKLLVEACIQKDFMRRPSAKSLLESPYFPSTVKASYLFLAPLHLWAKDGSCLHYAANFAKQGVLKAMGTFAAEMCASVCLSLVVTPLSDTEAEWAYTILKEFIKCLAPKAVKTIVLPAIQRILQTTGYSHLKVSILQDSFVQEIWNRVGKQAFLETVHPLVILNLYAAADKSSAAAASVLLIGSSEELGIPITIHQTILPLIQCFGKGLSTDGIDVLVRIGGLLGESFIVRQMLPLLKHVVRSCIDISRMNKPEPVQSWSAFALIDCLMTIDGLVAFLPREVVVKELVEDRSCLHVLVLMQTSLENRVLQVAATTLMAVCQRIGPDLTALHVLPQLKELFDELAFSPETANASTSPDRRSKVSKLKDGALIESRMDLALLLYPPFASLLGIEKLRQCCATWLLLERYLLRFHNWKWEHTGELSRSGSDTILNKRVYRKGSTPEYSPAKLLLNGVGWSIPQSQGTRGAKNLVSPKRFDALHQSPTEMHAATSNFKYDPWFWFPSPAASWDGPDYLGRAGGVKDEHPWKIRASVIHSVRAHPGALRYLAVCPDESTVFTAGIGAGFKGTVQKWELTRINCVSGYYGHEEVVNNICVLSSSGRVASCDGTIHVWNSRTGKLISVFSEPSVDSAHIASPPSSSSRVNVDQGNMLSSNSMSSGILTGAFDGSLYTCMHQTGFGETLVVGTGNGSLRFIDVVRGQKLHLWKGDSMESGFPSIVSTICSCGSDKMQPDGASSPSWIAAGMSSGQCRLFDSRSGNVVASWRAHDGYVTKLAAPEDHLLVSSSLDKTLRIWDLRRNMPSQPTILRGHTDGVSAFSVWGQDVISIARNKIGLSSLSKSSDDDGQQAVTCQKLYMADHGARNFSVLSSISILPFSRLFLVGTEDGYLRICC